jgi:hypothetical protein
LPQDVGLRLVEYLEQARPMNALGRACVWQLYLAHFGSLIWPTPGFWV